MLYYIIHDSVPSDRDDRLVAHVAHVLIVNALAEKRRDDIAKLGRIDGSENTNADLSQQQAEQNSRVEAEQTLGLLERAAAAHEADHEHYAAEHAKRDSAFVDICYVYPVLIF